MTEFEKIWEEMEDLEPLTPKANEQTKTAEATVTGLLASLFAIMTIGIRHYVRKSWAI